MPIERNTPISVAQFAELPVRDIISQGVDGKSAFALKALGQHASRAGQETLVTLGDNDNPVSGAPLKLVSFNTGGHQLRAQISLSERMLINAGKAFVRQGFPVGRDVKGELLEAVLSRLPARFTLAEDAPKLQFTHTNLVKALKNKSFAESLGEDKLSYSVIQGAPGNQPEIVAISLEFGEQPSEGTRKILELAGLEAAGPSPASISGAPLKQLARMGDMIAPRQRKY